MKIILFLLIGILALYLLALLGMYLFQDRFLFRPYPLDKNYQYNFAASNFQETFLQHTNQHQINALFFSSTTPSKGLILYFHGNTGSLKKWGNVHSNFTKHQYDLFIINYSGYGKSEGKPSEEQLYADARLAYQWAKERYKSEQIVIYGRSLGAAIATQLATEVVAKMLILETPFDEVSEVFRRNARLAFLPFKLKYKLSNLRNLPQILFPIHIFHGTNDRVVPYACAEQLKPVLKEKDSFTTLDNGTHHNLMHFELYQERLRQLLDGN